jgi:hypothetical protein
MKKRVFTKIILLLIVAASFTACKKDEATTPTPTNNTPAVNNKPNLVANKWITKKVYIDGAEQANHFLIESIYTFYEDNSYAFLIPGFGNAGGKWSFENDAQDKLKLEAQGAITHWKILTLTATAFIAEETASNGKVWKYEFAHL